VNYLIKESEEIACYKKLKYNLGRKQGFIGKNSSVLNVVRYTGAFEKFNRAYTKAIVKS